MSYKYKLYGAILGDLCGQPYEFPVKSGWHSNIPIHNPLSTFTDDTLMTLASASFIMGRFNTIEEAYKDMGNRYKGDYYGKGFKTWLHTPLGTQNNSYGNGCLMRISPYMYLSDPLPGIMEATLCSHFNGMAIESVMKLYHAYQGHFIYGINHILNKKVFQVEADATIDQCIQIMSKSSEETTRKTIVYAVSNGGDTDTNASIVGEYSNFMKQDLKVSDVVYVHSKLDGYLIEILQAFNKFITI